MPPKSSKPAGRRAPAAPARDAALRLLSQRAHSRAELGRKLVRRGYVPEDVEGAVTRMAELGYVDDRAFAEGHVRRRSSTRGPLALSAELAARGVDRRDAEAAVRGFDQAAQLASARHLAERLYAARAFAGFSEMLDSIGAKLVRRGFPPGVVRAACRAVWDQRAAG